MKEYELADVRFNNGGGALLCNECLIIIADGFEHEDRVHLCEECLLKRKRDWVGLTTEEMLDIVDTYGMPLAEAIEAKLRGKNR